MSITSTTLRAQIIQACQQLEVAGLNYAFWCADGADATRKPSHHEF